MESRRITFRYQSLLTLRCLSDEWLWRSGIKRILSHKGSFSDPDGLGNERQSERNAESHNWNDILFISLWRFGQMICDEYSHPVSPFYKFVFDDIRIGILKTNTINRLHGWSWLEIGSVSLWLFQNKCFKRGKVEIHWNFIPLLMDYLLKYCPCFFLEYPFRDFWKFLFIR